MKFRILASCLLAITFSQHAIAGECTSDDEQQKYVTNFVESFRSYANNIKAVEAKVRKNLSEKADDYAKNGLITKEQARNLFVNTLKDPTFNNFDKDKGVIHSEFMIKVALFEVEKSKPKEACIIAKEAFNLFEDIHNINLKQYKLLDERLENKKI